MSESNPTPDQGDERSKAYDLLYHFLNNNISSCDWQEYSDALDLLYSAQPVAQPVVDQEPASMSDNGSCGSQVSGKPVRAEAGKGVVHQFRKKHCSDWYDGFPDTEDGGGPYETRTLYVHPSESVAVSGEDWHEPRQLIAGARERANMVATEGSEAWLAEFTRAVLTLAAPMPQPEGVCPRCNGSGDQEYMTQHLGPDDYDVTGPCSECGGSGAVPIAQPQPEPTRKAEAIDWNEERQTDQSVTKPFTEWLARPGQHCQGVGANEAWNAGVAWATSQQREPQEAAELLSVYETLEKIAAFLNIDLDAAKKAPGKPSDVYIAAIRAWAALSAPQEAGKLAATEIDLPTDHDVLEHCDQNGTTLAEAAFALAKPSKEAGKVEPVADYQRGWKDGNDTANRAHAALAASPMFWVRLLADGLYEGPLHYKSADLQECRDANPSEWHPLHLHPAPQALGDDTKRLDWLEKHFTHISGIFLDSLNCVQHFEVDCEEDTLESGTTRIREVIDAAILAAAGGGEK